MDSYRIGLIVPSSNVTAETEVPALLRSSSEAGFTFHSCRMRTTPPTPAGLRAMNVQRERCVIEIADAAPDVILYVGPAAPAAGEPAEHRRVESLVAEQLATGGSPARIRSSAGALHEALGALGARRVALVTSCTHPPGPKSADRLAGAQPQPETESAAGRVPGGRAGGLEVTGLRTLRTQTESAAGRVPGSRVMEAARDLDLTGADALVLSACARMPSLSLIAPAEEELGLPVLSAATAGAFSLLRSLGLPTKLPGAGSLLSGSYR